MLFKKDMKAYYFSYNASLGIGCEESGVFNLLLCYHTSLEYESLDMSANSSILSEET